MSEAMSSEAPSVTLGGKRYPVRVLPFGVLRQCAVSFNEVGRKLGRGELDDDCLQKMGFVVRSGIDMDADAFEVLPFGLTDLINAYQKVAVVAGMTPAEPSQGGAAPGETTGGTGTPSTPT